MKKKKNNDSSTLLLAILKAEPRMSAGGGLSVLPLSFVDILGSFGNRTSPLDNSNDR